MIRLLYMYNQLQDNITYTQTILTNLQRRQSRIEYLMYRLIINEQSTSVATTDTNADTNMDIEGSNTNPSVVPSPSITTPPVTPPEPPRHPPHQNQTTQPQTSPTPTPPLTQILSNIFSNVPNHLPNNTTSSVNPNYRNYSSHRTTWSTERTDDFDEPQPSISSTPPHANGNSTTQNNNNHNLHPYDYSQNYITSSFYITPVPSYYNASSLSSFTSNNEASSNSTPNLTSALMRNILNETITPRNIMESMLFAFMDISYNYVVEDGPLTEQEISTNVKCCEFKDIQNPLNMSCPITMDAFQSNSKVIQLIHCGHIFTETELRRWLVNKRICPMCRHQITQQPQQTQSTQPTQPTL